MDPNAAETTLYFCRRCGACCCWPGYVHVSDQEIAAMAAELGMRSDAFIENYTRLTSTRHSLSLTENEKGQCIFFIEPNRCRVYRCRPGQCRSFPYDWQVDDLEEHCPCIRLRYRIRNPRT